MRTVPLVIAALLASSLAGTANAGRSAPDTPQREVSFADLDLSHDADVKKLHRRIRIAAREVCRDPGVPGILWRPRIRQCVEEATERALSDVARREGTTRMAGELK